jgi:hypothetical protein
MVNKQGVIVGAAKKMDLPMSPVNILPGPGGQKWTGQYFELEIFATETERSDVFVGVNGFPYTIKRGHKVVVPEPVVEALKDAAVVPGSDIQNVEGVIRETRRRFNFVATPVNV